MWFMQDGAPAHTARRVVAVMDDQFRNRWIGNNSPVVRWPARSPDLNPLDFYAWPTISNMVHTKVYRARQELQEAIVQACRDLSFEANRRAVDAFDHRLTECQLARGGHFEQYNGSNRREQ